ncbi:MAG TPA: RtcB family protein [Syntrophorhabdaceae bacterium]|nr:RtcB family protein [Syntrophorhabdaceae bacterium]
MTIPSDLIRIDETLWELPVSHKTGMLVSARIYATEKLMGEMDDGVFEQISNVACLPGVVNHAFCMPDGHWGYGFPIGGVAAMDPEKGVISPGGIGFDINCGMRLVLTNLSYDQLKPRLKELVDKIFLRVPSGVGSRGFLKLTRDEFKNVITDGSRWCLQKGYAWSEDLERTEEGGCFEGADPEKVSERAVERGFDQMGTLGSGNHYCEIQVARTENTYDEEVAKTFGFGIPNQVVIMFHCGSRGFGHQVATDHLKIFLEAGARKYGINVPDRELACAPFSSPEGQAYFSAMKCAVNMAFANRQLILHRLREVFSDVFNTDPASLGMHMIYDVAHNTAKLEWHKVDGELRRLLVHRKGSTRALGPAAEGLPECYSATGQPVIIGGSMETGSHLLVGSKTGNVSFFSTAHGSGRTMSRGKAKKQVSGRDLQRDMESRGIFVRTASWSGLAEEAGIAYKDIDEVVRATELAGLSRRVLKLLPIGNVKG